MKKIILIPMLLLSLTLPVQYSLAQGGGKLPDSSAKPPDAVVRGFYAWYLDQLNNDNFNPLKLRATALKYLSPELLGKAPRLTRAMSADIFICAQDFDPEWERNISLSQSRSQGPKSSTLVVLQGSEMSSKIRVTLRRLNPGWRIDAVECVFD